MSGSGQDSLGDDAEPAGAGGVREVKSAARTVELLEFLAARQNRPARLRELSEALGVPRSSLHALLRTLAKYGWVRADPTGTLYGIGIRALLAGTSYLDTDPYLPLVLPVLDELREQLDETFHFGRLDGQDVVYLATRESSQHLRPYSRVGRRLPAYSTSLGKSLLSARTGDELEQHLPAELGALTPHTIVDRPALYQDLAATRQRGHAVDNQENSLGLKCFAVPLGYAEPAVDAISASIPIARLNPQREAEVIQALRRAGDRIARVVTPVSLGTAWVQGA
ncbi:IclR family transcriptional regulator [Kineosporia sp. J2-2]|uniref:IclR family transcriptional regulator n=1 Tax=Kineosporia corallincola TaxID=2835133 RepID=A0ABS5TP53_9ACTN|nr:IclR family transcriptional regulator [Kineosporia corallincola]MBT0772780.1 IclR family transcriptional regulator [Kineosporia corallincola]